MDEKSKRLFLKLSEALHWITLLTWVRLFSFLHLSFSKQFAKSFSGVLSYRSSKKYLRFSLQKYFI